MKPGKLIHFAANWTGGYTALDVHGCAWEKKRADLNWEPVETPYQQWERLTPAHAKRSLQRRPERRKP